MRNVIEQLSCEHRTIAALLDLMEGEIAVFETGERPDYELVQDILRYLLTYPDLVHHPKEDAVLQQLEKVAPEAAAEVGDLAAKHHRLSRMLRMFNAALSNVLADEHLPRAWFAELARDFVDAQREHIRMEETVFFPAARRHLDDIDWAAVAMAVAESTDPLARCNGIIDSSSLKACIQEELAGS